jgi:hypothetical protein
MNARTFAQMLNHKLFLGANLAKKPAERILVSSHGPSYVAKGNPRCIWTNRDTHRIEREGATDFAKADAEQISSERTVTFRNTIFGLGFSLDCSHGDSLRQVTSIYLLFKVR